MTSHKIPEGLPKPADDDDEEPEEPVQSAKNVLQRDQSLDAKVHGLGSVDQSLDPSAGDDLDKNNSKRQARVELENFSAAGVLQEEGIRKLDTHRTKEEDDYKDSIIPGVQVRYDDLYKIVY